MVESAWASMGAHILYDLYFKSLQLTLFLKDLDIICLHNLLKDWTVLLDP